jgi:hypothetical protein
VTPAPNTKIEGIDADFTTQMLFCAVKGGIAVNIGDMGLNVFYDLMEYSAQIDALTLSKVNGKNVHYSVPQSVAEMTIKGKMRG